MLLREGVLLREACFCDVFSAFEVPLLGCVLQSSLGLYCP